MIPAILGPKCAHGRLDSRHRLEKHTPSPDRPRSVRRHVVRRALVQRGELLDEGNDDEGQRVERDDEHGVDQLLRLHHGRCRHQNLPPRVPTLARNEKRQVDRSQNSPRSPNLIKIPTLFKLCKIDLPDLLGV